MSPRFVSAPPLRYALVAEVEVAGDMRGKVLAVRSSMEGALAAGNGIDATLPGHGRLGLVAVGVAVDVGAVVSLYGVQWLWESTARKLAASQ